MPCEDENFSPLTIQREPVEVDPGAGYYFVKYLSVKQNPLFEANSGHSWPTSSYAATDIEVQWSKNPMGLGLGLVFTGLNSSKNGFWTVRTLA